MSTRAQRAARSALWATATTAAKGAQYTGRALLGMCDSDVAASAAFADAAATAASPLSNGTWTLEMLESLPTV